MGYDVLRFTILSYNTLCFFSYSREGTEGLKKSVFRRVKEVSVHVEKLKCQFIASNSSASFCSHPFIGVIDSFMQTFN